jgi:hypothetical protein
VDEGIFLNRFSRAIIRLIFLGVFLMAGSGFGGKNRTAAAAPPDNRKKEIRIRTHFFDPPDGGTSGNLNQIPAMQALTFSSKELIIDNITTLLSSKNNCDSSELNIDVCETARINEYFSEICAEGIDFSRLSSMPIPAIPIKYDRYGNYDPHSSWAGVDTIDLLARAMLAEENSKLCDPEKDKDFVGAGWVMVNRTRVDDGYFDYAEGSLQRALLSFQQFALTGTKRCKHCPLLPGNAAIVANPESYYGWFGGDPRTSYWKSYLIAVGILNGKLSDPTYGALFFSDASYNDDGEIVKNEDGRTRFKYYIDGNNYSINELEEMEVPPWP